MCDPVTATIAVVGGAMAANTYEQGRQARSIANAQRRDAENATAERKAAADKAAQDAQLARADQRRRLRQQSLLATGAQGVNSNQPLTSSVLSYGKQQLGG